MPSVPDQTSSLFYQKTGTGKKVVLWFHGFGQDHRAFDTVLQGSLDSHTHYRFDLFFHGNSTWAAELPITREDLHALFKQFLLEQNISHFSVVAFSIGCRFAFVLTECFPARIQHLILLAPDGIQFRFWYWAATHPAWSRAIFQRIVTRPALWHRLLSFLEFTHVIDKKLLRFAQRQMDSEQKRLQVYHAWINFRHLKSTARVVSRLTNENQISVTLVAGSRDRLVPAGLVKKLQKTIPAAALVIVDTNHNDLIRMSGTTIFKVLNNE